MLYAIVAVIALILDQAVKYWTTANIVLNTGTKDFIPGFLHLTNIHNTGAAFSILEGARWFFVILCLAFVALIIYVLLTDIINTPGARWMAVMVMAGAIGNCIDRVICGYVVDMFEFEGFMSWFPVFNVADIYITVCGVLFCIFTLLEKPRDPKAAATKAEPKAVKSPFTGMKLPSRAKKTPIPDFPKREHIVDETRPDPNDPFAEWERRAQAASQPKAESAPVSDAAKLKAEAEAFVRAQSKAEAPAAEAPKAESKVVEQTFSAEELKTEPAKPAAPVAKPAAPSAAPKAAEQISKAVADFDFDIDDILAEFKDI